MSLNSKNKKIHKSPYNVNQTAELLVLHEKKGPNLNTRQKKLKQVLSNYQSPVNNHKMEDISYSPLNNKTNEDYMFSQVKSPNTISSSNSPSVIANANNNYIIH